MKFWKLPRDQKVNGQPDIYFKWKLYYDSNVYHEIIAVWGS